MTTPVVYRSLVHHHRFIVCAVYSHFFSPRQSSLDDPVVGGRHHHLHCIITAQFFISLKYFMSTIIPRIFLCCSYFFSSVASPNNPTDAAVVIYAHAKRITKVEKLLRMGDSSSFHPPGWSLPPTRHGTPSKLTTVNNRSKQKSQMSSSHQSRGPTTAGCSI